VYQLTNDRTRRAPEIAYVIIVVVTGILAAVSDDPILTLACGSVLALSAALLWRLGEAAVLFMVAAVQLSQVVVRVFYADLLAVPLEDVSQLSAVGDVTSATWFALAAMLSLVIGMWWGQWRRKTDVFSKLRTEAKAWTPRAAFAFCLATGAIGALSGVLGKFSPGLIQPAVAAGRIEWLGVYVLTCVCVAQRRGYKYFLLVAGAEIIQGFMGFFGDFKQVFIVVLIALFSVKSKLSLGNILSGLLVVTLALVLGAFWSYNKEDYRTFISQGSQGQVVVVPVEERLEFLANRANQTDWQSLNKGLQIMINRWGYVDLLAATMANVPARVPFENGARIGAAIMHVLQPRLFFPDKPPLPSDTEIAVRYSGIGFDIGNNAAVTSISLGYVTELYVDFGILGTLAVMFIMGLGFGRAVRFLTSSGAAIVNSGLAVVLMMSVMLFEEGLTKALGDFLMSLFVVLIIKKYLLPYLAFSLPTVARAASPAAG
jgi:hypothetical protein